MYQEVDGRRKEVAGSYVLSRSGGRAESAVISFDVGEYDHSKPLVIDPVLVYSGLLGGIGDDVGWNVAVDSAGNSIVVGETTSVGFPTTNAIFPIYQGDPLSSGNPREVFISKIGPAGTNLIFSTFLGGTDDDAAYAVALDGVDNIYVTGQTASSNFPVTLNAVSRTIHGVPFFGYYPYDAFVTKLNASGTNLMYSTYLGGTRDDVAVGITVDTGANAYVTGFTSSLDFPTINSSAPFGGGITDAFVTKLTMQDSNPVYSLVLGGLGEDRGQSIGVDAAGEALVTGFTDSRDFPTANAVQASYGGGVKDVFVTRLSADGSTRLYSTYLGGSADDEGFYLAVDAPGNAIVTGLTTSTNFPVVNALFSTNHGASDVFVAKIVPAGTSLSYSTYFGGSATDEGWGVVLGTNGSAFIVGTTTSTNYLVSEEIQRGLRASFDVFVFGLDATGTGLLYSVAFGGSGNDFGYGITLDSGGNAIITGGSGSSNFPLLPSTNGLPHGVFNGFSDVFLAKIHPGSLYLSITNQGTGTVALSWPEMFSNYSLQVTGALLATNTWTTATNPVVIGGTNIVVNYTNSGSNSFFRLQPGP
jgi:hypothetical protein